MSTVDERTRRLQEQSSKLVTQFKVDPKAEIAAERSRATFPVSELLHFLNGGQENVERRARLVELLSKTTWGKKDRRHFLSREEEYVGGLKAALGVWELVQKEKLSVDDGLLMRQFLDFPGGLELHIGMFIPTLMSQATAEQQAIWLPKAFKFQIVGTYAQTELAHGTFVRGLETTATYDKEMQEFVLHSPTLTSTKWWPGGLGKTCTHTVVMARLVVEGKDCGMHAFLLQLRDLATHLPLPGITLGDIGPKFGYNGVDNGFMQLDHVRIPRDQMLMRYAQVTPDGRYVPPPAANAKASYATMMFVRADIVKNAGIVLGKAVTIATRYAAVRRQTRAREGEPETQLLDYQNVRHTLLPLLSVTYALRFMGDTMSAQYSAFEDARDKGDFSALPELHASSSGLKALCTGLTADGIEDCRRTCGGHGYSKLSGLPTLLANYVQNVTWEGDNNVLLLQVARYLLKALAAAQAGRAPSGGVAYLSRAAASAAAARCSAGAPGDWERPGVRQAALEHRTTRLCRAASELLARQGGGKVAFEGPVWNDNTVELIRLARAHCWCVLHANFVDTVERAARDARLGGASLAVLGRLASLFGVTSIERDLGEFVEDGYVSGAQAEALRSCSRALLRSLRPDAVSLVDAFGLSDYELNSALGRADGDVYSALLDMARGSPLNDTPEGPAWHGVLQPALAPTRARL